MGDAPVLQHSRLEPLADQSQQDAVTHPAAEDRSQMAVVQGIDRIFQEYRDVEAEVDPRPPVSVGDRAMADSPDGF